MRINQLTFLRFLAAIAIVILHFGMETYPFSISTWQLFIKTTNCLLAFFFMLSGFVLTVSSYRKPIIKKQFYFNRFVRIYPLYFFALALLVFARIAANVSMADITLSQILSNLTLTQAIFTNNAISLNYPGWSLSAEACFYLLFPFLYNSLNRLQTRSVIWICTLFWLFSVVVNITSIEFFKLSYNFTTYFAGFHLNSFILGIGTGIIFMRHNQAINKLKIELILNTLLLASVYIFLVLTENPILGYSNSGVVSPLFLSVILMFSIEEAPLKKILTIKPLVLLGEASYSIYILQYPVWIFFYVLARKSESTWVFNFYLCLVALIMFSVVTYLCLEKPLINKFRPKISQLD